MDSKTVILDASAFYAGVPFGTSGGQQYCTTPQVYKEIQHIKKSHDALEALLATGRLKVVEPSPESTRYAVNAAKGTGDYPQLSGQDISVIALSAQTRGRTVTDDYAISNVMKNLGLEVSPVMTRGIRDVGRWIHYCPGCRAGQGVVKNTAGTFGAGGGGAGGGASAPASRCQVCGTPLKRKLVKN